MFHLIVTCVSSKDKKYHGPSIAQANKKAGTGNFSVNSLYKEWKQLLHNQLQANTNAPTPLDLYQKGTWKAACDAYDKINVNGKDKKLWIISCGFGLVSATDKLCGYKCTFKNGETDSLYQRGRFIGMNQQEVKRKWWELLTSNPILKSNNPHTIHDLVNNAGTNDKIIIAAGKDYLDAIYEDLNKIILRNPSPILCLIGFKRLNFSNHFNFFDPCIPQHLKPFVSSFFNFNNYHRFLKANMNTCNMTQAHNRAAQYIISQYQNGGQLCNIFE